MKSRHRKFYPNDSRDDKSFINANSKKTLSQKKQHNNNNNNNNNNKRIHFFHFFLSKKKKHQKKKKKKKMACMQPFGLPLQDIVGTGFEHEGTERNRLAKQGWKEGDLGKGDFNIENEFEKEVNPVVIDYECDDDDDDEKNNEGEKGKEDASFFSTNAFDLKLYLEETFEVKIKRVFQPSQETFCFVTFESNADAKKMCDKKTIELKEKEKSLKVKVQAAKYANAKVQKWRLKVREAKAMDVLKHKDPKRETTAGESSLGVNEFASEEELNA
jgi:hypothetical protein